MPIPDFQTIMVPLLVHLSDGKEHSNQDTLKSLAEHFQLTSEELAQLLIESPRRGYYKIRPRGLEVLKANPSRVDLRVLNQFPEYVEFRYRAVCNLYLRTELHGLRATLKLPV